jgi:hypothetical protein
VARYGYTGKTPFHEKILAHGPTVARLGAGALLAAGVYGGSKLYDHFRQKKAPTGEYDAGSVAAGSMYA